MPVTVHLALHITRGAFLAVSRRLINADPALVAQIVASNKRENPQTLQFVSFVGGVGGKSAFLQKIDDSTWRGDYELLNVEGRFKSFASYFPTGFCWSDDGRTLHLTVEFETPPADPCFTLAFPDSVYRQVRADYEASVAERIKQ